MDETTEPTLEVPGRGAEAPEPDEAPATPSPIGPGYVVAGRYRVERPLGEGGAGRVWLARDLDEGGEVALKELWRRAGGGEDAGRAALLLRREFFAMRRLEHPGTVKVFDAGVLEGGHRYLVMERVRGRRLDDEVGGRPAGAARAYEVLARLAEVLAFIHARAFVHCDVKAGNVMVTAEGSLKLLDFGLMHPLGARPAGAVMGTPSYLAPEWQRGEPIDGRADLYALGVLGYYVAAGRLPFAGRSAAHLLDAHLLAEPPPPSRFAPVGAPLERILLRLLAKRPADRFLDAPELLAALAEASGRPPPAAPPAARASYLRLPRAVGREAEVARLGARLDEAMAGRSRALFVTAPAGAGKSHLLHEFELRARAHELPFATGQCRSEGLAPLAPLAQALRALAAATPAPRLDPHRAALQGLLRRDDEGAGAPAAGAPGSALDALVAWLRALGRERAFVLAFEDLHWADAATLEHLNVVVRALDRTRGLVVGAFRADEVSRTSLLHQTFDEGLADRLALAPLGRERLGELVGEALGGLSVPPELIDRLCAVTEGNAFFAIECLRLLIERDALCLVAGRWQAAGDLAALPLPATVEGAVRARASALPPPLLDFLRRLAPIGAQLELPLVRAVAGLPEAELFAALDEARGRHFLAYARGRYAFAHDTLQRALYDDTPPGERAAHHRRIAEALEAGGDDAARAVGYHFARSDEPWRAIAPLVLAGRRARAARALLDGTLLIAEAAELLEARAGYPGRARLLPALWAELVESGYTSDPPTCIRYAKRLLGAWDASGLAERGRREAFAAIEAARAGGPTGWGERLAALYRVAPGADELSPRETYVKIEEYRMYQCIVQSILGQLDEAAALLARVEAEQPTESPFRAASATARAAMSVHRGRSGAVLGAQRAAVEWLLSLKRQAGELPRPVAWGLGISTYVYNVMLALRGDPIDAEAREAGAEVAARYGLPEIGLFHVLAELGRAAFAGDGPAFRRLSAAFAERASRLGNPRLPERNAIVFMAPYYFERGEVEAAGELVTTAERMETRLPSDRWLSCHVQLYRGCAEAMRGERGPALRRAIEAAKESEFRYLTMLLAYEARAALAGGDRAGARASAEAALARATDPALSNPFDEIVARRALAAALGGEAAREHLGLAARLATATDNVLQDGLAHLELAESWAESGAVERARANLDRAEACLGRAGASVWLARAGALRRGALGPR
ncbi:MAG TPA: AAA family ATPase [Polyangiaceae bacterium]|nr:AAA family ATPase [Polyangiaceae bacterium]